MTTTRIRKLTADLEVTENVESRVGDRFVGAVEAYLRQRMVEPALHPDDPFAVTGLTIREAGDADVSGKISQTPQKRAE